MAQDQTLPQKHNYRIPVEAIIDLAEKNNSQTHIAKILGCHPSNISRRLKEIDLTKKYSNHKAFMIRYLEKRVYDNITDAKLKKANAKDLGVLWGIAIDKGNLEEGKPTEFIVYADMVKASKLQGDKGQAIQRAIEAKQGQSVVDVNTEAKCQSEDYQGVAGD